MDNKSVLTCLYAEYNRIRAKIRDIDKEREWLEANREALMEFESFLRLTLSDYGEFVGSDYRPNEDSDAKRKEEG